MKKLCYLVLVYNNVVDTLETLEGIKMQGYCEFDTVIVDNNSIESLSLPVKEYAEQNGMVYIYRDVNDGYTGGNNFGWKLLKDKYEYIFIVNNDIIFRNSNITELMLDILDNNSQISILGPQVQVYNNNFVVQSLFHKLFFTLFYPHKFAITEKYREIGSIIGCFLAIRTTGVKNDPLFDTSFFMYGEEHNLCFQVWRENKCVAQVVDKECCVYHKGGDNPYDNNREWKFYLSLRNAILCGRNFSFFLRIIYVMLCFISCLKMFWFAKYPVRCKIAAFKGIIKGCLFLRKDFNTILSDARRVIA